MALSTLSDKQLFSMRFEECWDHFASQIMLKGFGRPWQLYAAHGAIFAANYGGFLAFIRKDLFRLLFGSKGTGPRGEEEEKDKSGWKRSLASLLFVKFLVWQHLAEAIGCRQGPIGGYYALPNNWKYRLSLGTIKHPLLPFLGKKRNVFDVMVHALFFVAGAAFLTAKEYQLKYIRALCACDVWIFLSDMSQFYASTGHAYFSMLFSACFPEKGGRLAGMQAALLMQWFFSGIGKIGPWFEHVNAPFMLQSKFFAGQRWLFDLLVKSPTDLSPTLFGKVIAHTFSAVEYVAPMALMIRRRLGRSSPSPALADVASKPEDDTLAESTAETAAKHEISVQTTSDRLAKAVSWFGLIGITGMHAYILTMPAPFDVYSWNASFGLSAIYLFYYANFGFDHSGAASMNRGLAAYLLGEFVLCWYGQFFPDQVGYYLSHRYWAGNWVQTLFFVKNDAVAKLGRVKTCSANPQIWQSLQNLGLSVYYSNMSYLWLANLNMKASLGLIFNAVQTLGGTGASISNYFPFGLTQYCCGEFRDSLYAVPVLPTMQEQIGFDSGECFMVRLGAFGMFRDTATWQIYDLKDGLVKKGLLSLSALSKMSSFPSQSIAHFRDAL